MISDDKFSVLLLSLIAERIGHVGKTVPQAYNGVETLSNEVANVTGQSQPICLFDYYYNSKD